MLPAVEGFVQMKVYRVVIAVDHYDLLDNARLFVNQHRNFLLAGEAAIGSEFISLLNSTPADVAVFSMNSPNQMKREVIKQVSKRYPRLQLLFMYYRKPSSTVKYPVRGSGWGTAPESHPFSNTTYSITGIPSDLICRHWTPPLIEQ